MTAAFVAERLSSLGLPVATGLDYASIVPGAMVGAAIDFM